VAADAVAWVSPPAATLRGDAMLGTMFGVYGILYRGFKRNGWL
jgi:hypothetical protein